MGGKRTKIALLTKNIFTFQVIDCVLIYDIIRALVASFLEQDMELILLLIRRT